LVRNVADLLISVVKRGEAVEASSTARETCLVCAANLVGVELYERFRVCSTCRFHYSMTARERIDSLADAGTFRETNRRISSLDPLSFSTRGSYRARVFRDQRRTGLTEAVVSGTCSIGGSPLELVVLDFGFMGGTMGCVVGEKVALAMEHAAKRKLPFVAVVTSGGTRFQEGILSLMQMAKTSIAAEKLSAKQLPFISVLANPATGQAYASFGNLADIIVAEPGSIVGLTPMQVIKEASDQPVPGGSHTAESHVEHGMLDAVVDRARLRDLLAVLLDLLGSRYQLTATQKRQKTDVESLKSDAWGSVQLARHESRPTSLDYIERIVGSFVELHGDRLYGDDRSVVAGLGHLGGQTVVIVGQERGREGDSIERHDGMTSPEGFRKAQRAMRLAEKFDLPLITLIDTPGPYPSVDNEQRGLGNAIATTMSVMAGIEVPTIAAVIGQGGSEGALALGVADKVLMAENGIYSIISPEQAAGLIYQDRERAEEAAGSLKVTSQDCKELGIVDAIVPEPPGGAHTNPDEAARQLRRAILQELVTLQSLSKKKLLSSRYKKFRKMGEYSSHFRSAITREIDSLQGLVSSGVKRMARRGRSAKVGDEESTMAEEMGQSVDGQSDSSR